MSCNNCDVCFFNAKSHTILTVTGNCSEAYLIRVRDLDFGMIRGDPKPDQAEWDGQPLVNVHLNILTSLEA